MEYSLQDNWLEKLWGSLKDDKEDEEDGEE